MYGINAAGHRTKDALIVLHEKELNVVPGPTLADKVRAVDGVLYSASEIKQALRILNERERNVIEAFFGIGGPELTLEEIGVKYGLTRERVRQIKEKAIRQLREATKNKILKAYLGQ